MLLRMVPCTAGTCLHHWWKLHRTPFSAQAVLEWGQPQADWMVLGTIAGQSRSSQHPHPFPSQWNIPAGSLSDRRNRTFNTSDSSFERSLGCYANLNGKGASLKTEFIKNASRNTGSCRQEILSLISRRQCHQAHSLVLQTTLLMGCNHNIAKKLNGDVNEHHHHLPYLSISCLHRSCISSSCSSSHCWNCNNSVISRGEHDFRMLRHGFEVGQTVETGRISCFSQCKH